MVSDELELFDAKICTAAGSTAENISKQLRVLMNAGILENRPGEDRRQSVFSIPAAYRATPRTIGLWMLRGEAG